MCSHCHVLNTCIKTRIVVQHKVIYINMGNVECTYLQVSDTEIEKTLEGLGQSMGIVKLHRTPPLASKVQASIKVMSIGLICITLSCKQLHLVLSRVITLYEERRSLVKTGA